MGPPLLRIRETIPGPLTWGLGLIPPLLLLGLWGWVTQPVTFEQQGQKVSGEPRVSPAILPSPRDTVASFPSLWEDRGLSRSAVCSLWRVGVGFLIAAALALPLGILMGSFTKIKGMFNPLAVVGTYLPLPAIGMLILVWAPPLAPLLKVESSELYKYMYLAIVTFVVLLPQLVLAIENVEDIYLQTAYTQGAGRWQAVWKVLIPVALPDMNIALRTSFAVGWTYIILAEIYDPERGLGYLIFLAQRRGPIEHLYLVLLTIMLIGFTVDRLWILAGRWMFPYRAVR